ncbi:MAG: hypothetical protein ABJQ90_10695 [Parasphingorhabdus sp.]
MSWVAGATPESHAGSGGGDATIELLSELITWSVLVWFARKEGMIIWVFDGLEIV